MRICLLTALLSVLRVAFVGDPQVDNEQELTYARKSIYSELRNRKDLDLVVVLGDLVNEKPGLIAPSEASLDSIGCPWVRVNGNHDGPDPKKDTTFVQGGIRFILMDDVRRNKGYEGGLREDQKVWLKNALSLGPKEEKTVFCTHIPVSECLGRDSLMAMLSVKKDLLLVCGHTHIVQRSMVDGKVEEVMAGATCGTWWRGVKDKDGIPYALMNCGSPRGYFVADFNPARNEWYSLRYKAVLKDKDDMASARISEDGRLTVNVFGGAPWGNLEVKDGCRWQSMTNVHEVAPEVWEIIRFNMDKNREYRKAHKDEFMPMLRRQSSHIWAVDDFHCDNGKVKLRYSDPTMRFKTKIEVAFHPVSTK